MKYQQAIKTNPKRATQSSAKPMLSRCSPIHPLLQLQQTIGNRAASRFLQTKLRVNEPGDVSEQEADRVADEVMRMPEPPISRAREWEQAWQGEGEATTLQRTCAACASGEGLCPQCAEEEEVMQRKPLRAQITPLIQRQAMEEPDEEDETFQTKKAPAGSRSIEGEESVPPIVHEVLRSPGQPLDAAPRAFFEPRFGADFSQVRVNTDAKAARSAESVGALAYTVGRHIVFGEDTFKPWIPSGKALLAHELVHVVQQGAQEAPGRELLSGTAETRSQRESGTTAGSPIPQSAWNISALVTSPQVQRQAGGPETGSGASPASTGRCYTCEIPGGIGVCCYGENAPIVPECFDLATRIIDGCTDSRDECLRRAQCAQCQCIGQRRGEQYCQCTGIV
jgi:hypothetical protein